jgi:hypothetical protein
MITWVRVMAEVQRLEEKRGRGERLTPEDAEALVTMLRGFHNQAVAKVPIPSRPSMQSLRAPAAAPAAPVKRR